MKFRLFSFLIIISCLNINCGEKDPQDSLELDVRNEKNEKNEKVTKEDILKIDFADYGLSPASKTATENWLAYQNLSNNIDFMKDGDLTFISGDIEDLSIILEELKTTMPENLDTNPIRARLLALETALLKANSVIILNSISKKNKLSEIKNIFVAMSHFNDQMNKKFEIESNNIFRN